MAEVIQGENVLEFAGVHEIWIRDIEDTVYGSTGFVLVKNTKTGEQFYVAPGPPPNGLIIHNSTSATINTQVPVNKVMCDLVVNVNIKPDGNYIDYTIKNGTAIIEQIASTKCDPGGYEKLIGTPDKVIKI